MNRCPDARRTLPLVSNVVDFALSCGIAGVTGHRAVFGGAIRYEVGSGGVRFSTVGDRSRIARLVIDAAASRGWRHAGGGLMVRSVE